MELGLLRLVDEALRVPVWEYALLLGVMLALFLYHALDFHFVGDLITGLRGDVVELVYSPFSKIAPELVASCGVLNKRYRPTVWLCSPHLQTAFVHFFGRAPSIEYRRTLYVTGDGGTIALDWLDPDKGNMEEIPVVIVVPGLSSDSSNAYLKHLAHGVVSKGWRAVIANHRGLGGVSLTSDQFYNAGWTNDVRAVISDIVKQYPKAPLVAVGTSLGANILVKYLGEEGNKTPIRSAVAICCPWDLVVCDRFISRRPLQKIYDKALAIGLTDYVLKHEKTLSSLSNWSFIKKARSVRVFDNFFTRLVGKFETVDDYYRRSSCVYVLNTVAVPLLCVNSLDDPLCTKEAIPWDECRINPNLILAVTRHGGHLAYYEGITAKSVWWVRAVTDFVSAVLTTPLLKLKGPQEEEVDATFEAVECVAKVTEAVIKPQLALEEESSSDRGQQQIEELQISERKKATLEELCLKSQAELATLQQTLSEMLKEAPVKNRAVNEKKASLLTGKRALLLVAAPLVGSAVVYVLRRRLSRRNLF